MNDTKKSKPWRLIRPVTAGVVTFIFFSLVTQYLTYQEYLINQDADRERLNYELNSIRDRLRATMNHCVSATSTLAFIIKKYGVPQEFAGVARDIMRSDPGIDALELTNGGEITHIYPPNGGSSAV